MTNIKTMQIFIFIVISCLAYIMRFYKIVEVPPHLYWDEASIAYNAYSLNETGLDEWGQELPLLFRSFGDYKLPLYIYVTAISQKIFGFNDFAVRVPSALFGTITVIVIFFLTKELLFLINKDTKSKNRLYLLPFFSMLLLAVSPWHLQFSRAGFEANFSFFLQITGVMVFLLSVRKNIFLLFLSFLFFILSLYTYHSATITSPFLLLMLAFSFRRNLISRWRVVFLVLVFSIILVGPYVPTYLISAQGRTRFSSETVSNMPGNVAVNFINNFTANFSSDYLFFKGDQAGRHSVKKIGELFLWQLPAIVAGIFFLIKLKSPSIAILLLSWLVLSALPPALTKVSPHALRGLLSVGVWQIICSCGLCLLVTYFNKLKFILVPIFTYSLLVYLVYYYIHAPKAYSPDWQDGMKQVVKFIAKNNDKYDQVFVSNELPPVYLMLYLPYSPKALQDSGHNTYEFDKFKYESLNHEPQKINPERKSLIVAPAWLNLEYELIRQTTDSFNVPRFNIYEF